MLPCKKQRLASKNNKELKISRKRTNNITEKQPKDISEYFTEEETYMANENKKRCFIL